MSADMAFLFPLTPLVFCLESMNLLTARRLADYNTVRVADKVFSMEMEGRAEIRVVAPLSGLYAASSHEDHAAVYKLRP